MRISSHSANYDTIWLNIADTSVHHIWFCKTWKNQQVFQMVYQKDKHTVMETFKTPDFSLALESKLSAVSCDNAIWHTNYKEPDASATLCKIFQTLCHRHENGIRKETKRFRAFVVFGVPAWMPADIQTDHGISTGRSEQTIMIS